MIAYTAVETFNSSMGDKWTDYIKIHGSRVNLSHLKEIVSIDVCLCPTVIGYPIEKDKAYRLSVDHFFYDLFSDLDYMLTRIQTDKEFQVIAVAHNPNMDDVGGFTDGRFSFKGYDLMEDGTQISALTDCGGIFDLAYRGEDLSESGLITDFSKAYEIRDSLNRYYPEEAHADCSVWALWKFKEEHIPPIKKVTGARHIIKIRPLDEDEIKHELKYKMV